MRTSTAVGKTSEKNRPTGEYRLLLDRLRKAAFDDKGTEFVRQALTDASFLDHIEAGDLQAIALIAQQHGLLEQSLSVYRRLNTRFPADPEGWRQHLDLLNLLERREEMAAVMARAAASLPAEVMKEFTPVTTSLEDKAAQEPDNVALPFLELRKEEEQIRLYMQLFQGRQDAFARQWVNRKEEKQGYVPVRRPMQPSDVRDHLEGRRTYGIYLLDEQSRVHTGVIDVDLIPALRGAEQRKKQRAVIRRETLYLHKRIATLARQAGLCCLAEVSGGKGYHFWFPVREPVPAAAMRKALTGLVSGLSEDVQCFSLEIFPKQDQRTGKGFGNLVKLPLGIHRGTGKPSTFVLAADRDRQSQFELLAQQQPSSSEKIIELAGIQENATVVVHPRHAAWAEEYPELAVLESRCAMLGQLIATLRSSRVLSLREEKVILSTIGHLPRARLLLHHLFADVPEYNRALLDYKISRVRGTVLGCKRIHSLLESGGDLPCRFQGSGYPHPLRHIDDFREDPEPKNEKVVNLEDALACLKTAIRQVERFL